MARTHSTPTKPAHETATDGTPAKIAAQDKPWRRHPMLVGKFHPEYPDDLQVVVHDGGPRLSSTTSELVWVRAVSATDDHFEGKVLNRPTQLRSVHQDDLIHFVVPAGGEHPLMVRDKALAERSKWKVTACDRCGLTELFDAPSDLLAKLFPNMPEGSVPVSFTAICGMCGGVQVVTNRAAEDEAGPEKAAHGRTER